MAHAYAVQHGVGDHRRRTAVHRLMDQTWDARQMAYWDFEATCMSQGSPSRVFGDGSLRRDFTYVDHAVVALALSAQRANRAWAMRCSTWAIGSRSPFAISCRPSNRPPAQRGRLVGTHAGKRGAGDMRRRCALDALRGSLAPDAARHRRQRLRRLAEGVAHDRRFPGEAAQSFLFGLSFRARLGGAGGIRTLDAGFAHILP